MWMPRAGVLGALPLPAWVTVASVLSTSTSPPAEGGPLRGRAWQTTVLELRRTCKALAELVGAGCVGGAGRLKVLTVEVAVQLEAAATAGLERALVVDVRLHCWKVEEREALARALELAVERGHMIKFKAQAHERAPAAARKIEAALIEASREGQLLYANLYEGESLGWSLDAMSQLSAVELSRPGRDTIETIAGARALDRITFYWAQWTDLSILSSLHEVKMHGCAVKDLSPLANVPLLFVSWCRDVQALPAMRNAVLVVAGCRSLTDLSGLAGGRVGRLELWDLDGVKDVSAIGAMQPPPRTVILWWMDELQDVSMPAGIHRLEVIECRKLDKAATLAALEGKVGTIRWDK